MDATACSGARRAAKTTSSGAPAWVRRTTSKCGVPAERRLKPSSRLTGPVERHENPPAGGETVRRRGDHRRDGTPRHVFSDQNVRLAVVVSPAADALVGYL